jgi:hypothetical protein
MNNIELNKITQLSKELYINNTRELSKLIDKYLIPQESEKNSNAEVSTPYALRKEMLDSVSESFWKSLQTVFEPCAGKGGFLIDIIDRFMNGLKDSIPDEKVRYKTIVEKCVYFSDINPTNIFICKLLVDPYNQYKLNYHEGSTIELDIQQKWNLIHFAATIGNPPYNEDPNKTNNPHMKPIYQDWIYKFSKLSDILLFITPSKWFSSEDKQLVELRNYMKECNIEFIKHFPNDDVFKNVTIKGGVSYFIINKSYTGKTLLNGVEVDLKRYDIILEPKYYKLIEYLDNNNHFENNLSSIYCSQGTFLNDKSEKELLKENNTDTTLLCYVSKQKGLKQYILKDKIKKDYNYWKIITPAAAFSGTSGFADIYKLSNTEVHSRSYVSFKVNSEFEADSLFSYLKCKLPHVLLSTRKITHNLCNESVFKWIPYVPLDRIWNNQSLYAYFKFDDEIIKIIENANIEGSYNK